MYYLGGRCSSRGRDYKVFPASELKDFGHVQCGGNRVLLHHYGKEMPVSIDRDPWAWPSPWAWALQRTVYHGIHESMRLVWNPAPTWQGHELSWFHSHPRRIRRIWRIETYWTDHWLISLCWLVVACRLDLLGRSSVLRQFEVPISSRFSLREESGFDCYRSIYIYIARNIQKP